jgi:hypothetical protein
MWTKSFSTCKTKGKKQLLLNDKSNHVHKRLEEHHKYLPHVLKQNGDFTLVFLTL